MNLQHIIVYVLAAVTLATAIIYFIIAYNEYISLIEFAAEGLEGEIPELQIEIALFAGSGYNLFRLIRMDFSKEIKKHCSLFNINSYFYNIDNYICCIQDSRSSHNRCRVLYWKI